MLLYYYRKGVITIKKSSKIISISVKKAYITGFIISLTAAIACSYLAACLAIDAGIINDSITTFRLAIMLLPIIFITFFMLIALFIAIYSPSSKKSK